jgi:hypothetical protein
LRVGGHRQRREQSGGSQTKHETHAELLPASIFSEHRRPVQH